MVHSLPSMPEILYTVSTLAPDGQRVTYCENTTPPIRRRWLTEEAMRSAPNASPVMFSDLGDLEDTIHLMWGVSMDDLIIEEVTYEEA